MSPDGSARPVVAAGALFVDDADRIMLVRPVYKDHWDIPGGYVEPGESPRAACVRELTEELGIRVDLGPLLVVDWAPTPDEGDKLLFVFDGGRLSAEQHTAIRLDPAELTGYRYAAPAEAVNLLTDRLVRRLAAAMEVRKAGRATYLEHGEAVDE